MLAIAASMLFSLPADAIVSLPLEVVGGQREAADQTQIT
jgi:hypothetical protein